MKTPKEAAEEILRRLNRQIELLELQNALLEQYIKARKPPEKGV